MEKHSGNRKTPSCLPCRLPHWKVLTAAWEELGVDQALYVTRADRLRHWDSGTWKRLYFGVEFCERLIAGSAELEDVLAFAADHDVPLTLVTPYMTGAGLRTVTQQLEHLAERAAGSEVIFNDWGTLRLLTTRFTSLKPVLGRLLTKQKRGPRLVTIAGKVPETLMDHFRHGGFEVPQTAAYLKEVGVERVELDNLLQGIRHGSSFKASLYLPFVYVSTTRICLSAGCDWETRPHQRAVFPCGFECRKYTFRLEHKDMPVPVILKGNTQFYHNDKLPDGLRDLGIDRIVVTPEPPVL